MQSFFAILICIIVIFVVINAECPPINRVNECRCKTVTDHTGDEYSTLTCRNLHSEDDLKFVVQSTYGYSLYELELIDCSFRYIPDDVFVGTFFKVISIKNSSIYSLSNTDVAFGGLENQLHLLEIVNSSYIGNWDWSQVSNLVEMIEIHISDSNLYDITEGISRIQHLDVEAFVFQKNNIEVLDDRAFTAFTDLKRLALDNNHISRLKRTMFPKPATGLNIIALSYNRLQNLPEDLFVDMPRLNAIYLSGNPLLTIDEFVFEPVWNQLTVFLFYGTNLTCDCKITWLARLNNTDKYMHAECHEPVHFKGRLLNLIQPDELIC